MDAFCDMDHARDYACQNAQELVPGKVCKAADEHIIEQLLTSSWRKSLHNEISSALYAQASHCQAVRGEAGMTARAWMSQTHQADLPAGQLQVILSAKSS